MKLRRSLYHGLLTVLISLTILQPVYAQFSSSILPGDPQPSALFSEGEPNPVPPTRIVVRTKVRGLFGWMGQPSPATMKSEIERSTLLPTTFVKQNGDFQVYTFDHPLNRSELQQKLAQMQRMEGVADVFEDAIVQASLTPNDLYFSAYQAVYLGTGVGGINAMGAWNITSGDPNMRVAILDTGKTDHPDLAGRWVGGYDFVDVAFGNDADGWDADPTDPGDGSTLQTSTWHGTHVAGIFGANGNNNIGVAGINWNSLIVPVRVLGKGGGWMTDVADAIRWAAGLPVVSTGQANISPPDNPYPARILNLSLGAPVPCDAYLQSAIDDAVAQGAIIVVAADNQNSDTKNVEPAGCQNVITVGASNNVLPDKSSYSNFGTAVTLSAPGDSIVSTVYPGSVPAYGIKSGTSMATPFVTGVVSLMLAINPSLRLQDIKTVLRLTARPFPANADRRCQQGLCGAGILNALAAVQMAQTGWYEIYLPLTSK
jgi:serine protease